MFNLKKSFLGGRNIIKKVGIYLICLENDIGFNFDKIKLVVYMRFYKLWKCFLFEIRKILKSFE